jgi:cholesterol transport system auxiliary component
VLDASAAAALARRGAAPPPVLRVELEEFSQLFESPTASPGVLRLRCTLLENTGGGERLVAQRSFSVQRPAPSADASGGVRALAAATDAAAQDIAAWLQQR